MSNVDPNCPACGYPSGSNPGCGNCERFRAAVTGGVPPMVSASTTPLPAPRRKSAKELYPRTIAAMKELHELMPDEATAEREAVMTLLTAAVEETVAMCGEGDAQQNRQALVSALARVFPAPRRAGGEP